MLLRLEAYEFNLMSGSQAQFELILMDVSGILIVFDSSALCAWLGVGIMGLGFSSMYGAVSGLVFQYLHIRPYHVSVILVTADDLIEKNKIEKLSQ